MKAGWQTNKLGEVCSFLNRGISPKYLEEGGICVLNQKCVRDHAVNFFLARRHDNTAKRVSSDRLVQAGDVLINSTGTGTLGRVAQVRKAPIEPTTVDSHVTIARPLPGKFFSEFFGYMLIFIEEAIKKAGEGCGGQTELARAVLAEKFSVTYPSSHSEQHRIVALLDEAFNGIATARANAEKNLHNARDLFESYLQSVFTQRGEGWVEEPLESLIESSLIGLTRSTREQGDDKKYPYVKMNHITRDNRFEFTDYVKVDATIEEADRFVLKDGDFLFNTRNSHELVGKSCIYTPALEGAVLYNNNLMRIRFKSGIDARFVLFAFSCRTVAEELEGLKSGTTNVSAIYFKDLRNLRIPLPPTAKQERISDELIALSGETQRLESLYQRKLVALDALKQSLLHQAFSGQL